MSLAHATGNTFPYRECRKSTNFSCSSAEASFCVCFSPEGAMSILPNSLRLRRVSTADQHGLINYHTFILQKMHVCVNTSSCSYPLVIHLDVVFSLETLVRPQRPFVHLCIWFSSRALMRPGRPVLYLHVSVFV